MKGLIKQHTVNKMCVTSLLCGPLADLWLFYGLYCKRFSLSTLCKGLPRLGTPAKRPDRSTGGKRPIVLLSIRDLSSRRICIESELQTFPSGLNSALPKQLKIAQVTHARGA